MTALDKTSPALLGERLRIARSSARVTQDKAAQAIGVARTTMVAIENGTRRIKSDELMKLASLYNVSCNSLLRPESIHVDLVPQFRRNSPAIGEDESTAEVTALLQRLASSYVELERMLNMPLATNYLPEIQLSRTHLNEQAEDQAVMLRTRLGVGLSPIPDIASLLETEIGLRVFVRPLPSKISGAFAYDPVLGACIILNSKHPPKRRIWTLIHEIAHFLSRRNAISVIFADKKEDSVHERFADLFTGAFLMPAVALRRRFLEMCEADGKFSPRSLIFLARTHYVSLEAMTRRLERLGLLPQGMYESLRERGLTEELVRSAVGNKSLEENILPPSERFILLAAEAYSRGLLSEGQVAKMLAVDRLAVREMLDAVGGDSAPEGEYV
ncbi:XRE family transcriptional regulator [Archangium violaceum]|uniref:ImmA/IrrE family metallo-endopeptidase n=1 Tax=Archangium violaceum TaxID=83451 RepID=UPI002B2E76D7|nr:XRE family transcriptional regulator [Archangium gephyra]